MPRPKKQKNNSAAKQDSTLYMILWDLHNHIDKADELVEYLEGIQEGSKSREFCKAYVVKLIQEYVDGGDAKELMLAACNLLKGFNNKNLDDRMQAYRKYIGGYNSLIKESWSVSTYSTNYRNLLKTIINNLEPKLESKMEQNDGKLGLINAVLAKLELPAPRSLPANSHNIKNDVPSEEITTDAPDGKLLINTDGSIVASQDSISQSKVLEVNEEENKTEDYSDDTPKKSDNQEQNSGNTDVLGDVTAHKTTDKKKKRRSGRKNTYNIHNVFRKIGIIFEKKQVSVPLLVIAIIGMVMISVSLFQIADALRHGNSNELAETSNENSTPKIEMIHVFNKDITLRPNQSEKIKVGLYPHDADENDLNYISKNTDIATVDDLIVTAKDWQEGNNTTKIEVGGGNAEFVEVGVTVDPPATVDGHWNNIATKNGMNPDDGNGEYK